MEPGNDSSRSGTRIPSTVLDDLRFTDSPHPHKQETRGLDTIQATSLFPWWLLVILFRQREVCKKIPKSGKILRNHRPDVHVHLQKRSKDKQQTNMSDI